MGIFELPEHLLALFFTFMWIPHLIKERLFSHLSKENAAISTLMCPRTMCPG
jgi:hypothetical protein